MSPLDIVYCYVSDQIFFDGDFSKLQSSFRNSGFREKRISDNIWKYTRGSAFALEFNYDSEVPQMQVFLEKLDSETLSIKVGNWGFPFEPLLMKNRFKKNLQQIKGDIEKYQLLTTDNQNLERIKKEAKNKNMSAIIFLTITVTFSIIFYVVFKSIL